MKKSKAPISQNVQAGLKLGRTNAQAPAVVRSQAGESRSKRDMAGRQSRKGGGY